MSGNDHPNLHGNTKWTPEQDAILTRAWAEDRLSATQMGHLIGKSKGSTLSRARRIGLPPKGAPTTKWTPEQLEQAKAMRAADTPWKAIADALGVGDEALRQKAMKDGWGGPKRSRVVRSRTGWVEHPPKIANRRPPNLASRSGHYSASQDTTCRTILNDDLRRPEYCPHARLPGKAWCGACFARHYVGAPRKVSA